MMHHTGCITQVLEAGYWFTIYHSIVQILTQLRKPLVKSIVKANEENWDAFDVETAVAAAFNCISKEDCKALGSHCDYN